MFTCWSHIKPAALTSCTAVTTAVTSTTTTTITAVQILYNGLSFPELLHIRPGFSQDVSEGTFGDNWSSFIQAGCCLCRPDQQCQTAEITDADQVKSSGGRHPFFCCQLKGRYTADLLPKRNSCHLWTVDTCYLAGAYQDQIILWYEINTWNPGMKSAIGVQGQRPFWRTDILMLCRRYAHISVWLLALFCPVVNCLYKSFIQIFSLSVTNVFVNSVFFSFGLHNFIWIPHFGLTPFCAWITLYC